MDTKVFYLPGEKQLIPVNIKIHLTTPNSDSNYSALLEFEDGSKMISSVNFMKVFDHYAYGYEEPVVWPLETMQERIEYVKRALEYGFKKWDKENEKISK